MLICYLYIDQIGQHDRGILVQGVIIPLHPVRLYTAGTAKYETHLCIRFPHRKATRFCWSSNPPCWEHWSYTSLDFVWGHPLDFLSYELPTAYRLNSISVLYPIICAGSLHTNAPLWGSNTVFFLVRFLQTTAGYFYLSSRKKSYVHTRVEGLRSQCFPWSALAATWRQWSRCTSSLGLISKKAYLRVYSKVFDFAV